MKKKIYYSTGLIILTFLMILLVMSFTFQQSVPDSHQAFIEEKGWDLAFYFPKKRIFSRARLPRSPSNVQNSRS
jgi:hypothetical protein